MLIAFNGQRLRRVKNCTPKSMQRGPECALVAVPLPACCPCHTSSLLLPLTIHFYFISLMLPLRSLLLLLLKVKWPQDKRLQMFPFTKHNYLCMCMCVFVSVCGVVCLWFCSVFLPAFAGIRKLLAKSFASANLRLPPLRSGSTSTGYFRTFD